MEHERHDNGQAVSTGSSLATAVYILYLVSLALGVTALIGVVIAYVYRPAAPTWLGSHYHFQIRTFWIGFLYSVIGALLTVIGVGFLIWLLVAIWLVVRCVKGMQLLQRGEEHPAPYSWWL